MPWGEIGRPVAGINPLILCLSTVFVNGPLCALHFSSICFFITLTPFLSGLVSYIVYVSVPFRMGPIQPVLLGMIEQPFLIFYPDSTTSTNPYFGQESEGEATTCSSSVHMDTAGRNRLGRNASVFVWGNSETVRRSIPPLRASRIIVPNWCGQVKILFPEPAIETKACHKSGRERTFSRFAQGEEFTSK